MMQTLPHTRFTRPFSFMVLVMAYLLAYAFAAFSVVLLKNTGWHPLFKLALADVVGTVVIFCFSTGFKNSSFYDAYWSVAPVFFLVFLIPLAEPGVDLFRQVLVSLAILAWGTRLTLNWGRHWKGIKMEDWRYVRLKKERRGASVYLVDFFGIHLFPTAIVFGVCLPLYPALVVHTGQLGAFDLLGFALCLTAILIETISDEQLRLFKKRIRDPHEFMKNGLWQYSRHPNYFGEWLFWVGIYLMGLIANPAYWWTGIGVLLLLALFLFASIPMMDKHMMAKRPEYAEHMKRVPAFFPIFW